jgi:hypothetical protein
MKPRKDFFIDYHPVDRPWAEWSAWHLEHAGYVVVVPAWDFRPGANVVQEIQRATVVAQHTIAILSPEYLAALNTQPAWAAAFAADLFSGPAPPSRWPLRGLGLPLPPFRAASPCMWN